MIMHCVVFIARMLRIFHQDIDTASFYTKENIYLNSLKVIVCFCSLEETENIGVQGW